MEPRRDRHHRPVVCRRRPGGPGLGNGGRGEAWPRVSRSAGTVSVARLPTLGQSIDRPVVARASALSGAFSRGSARGGEGVLRPLLPSGTRSRAARHAAGLDRRSAALNGRAGVAAAPASVRRVLGLVAATGLLLALVVLAFSVGRFPVGPGDVWRVLWAAATGAKTRVPDIVAATVLRVRGPRVLGAMGVGAALAAAGSAYQGLFRNPLVSPDILGASSGAALGAVLGIYFSL